MIPFCNELPQAVLTIQSVIEELDGFCDYEVIAVDNRSDQQIKCTVGPYSSPTENNYFVDGFKEPKLREYSLEQRNYFKRPDSGKVLSTLFFRQGKIKYFIYDDKLSHWNAKNVGIKESKGKYVMFLDAHCIMKRDSIRKMITFLREKENEKIGAVHSYINYMLDSNALEYRTQIKFFGYQFCSHQRDEVEVNGRKIVKFKSQPYKVAVMSTCGMMCPRKVLDELGGWNPELGIYGGGESYINWKQSTCGYPHWIHPEAWCWHYADKRGYSWNHVDYIRNSFIAAYCVGGDKWLDQQVVLRKEKDRPAVIDKIAEDVRAKCGEDRKFIAERQVISLEDFINTGGA